MAQENTDCEIGIGFAARSCASCTLVHPDLFVCSGVCLSVHAGHCVCVLPPLALVIVQMSTVGRQRRPQHFLRAGCCMSFTARILTHHSKVQHVQRCTSGLALGSTSSGSWCTLREFIVLCAARMASYFLFSIHASGFSMKGGWYSCVPLSVTVCVLFSHHCSQCKAVKAGTLVVQ